MFPSAAAYASSGGPVEARNSVARIITEYEDGYGIGTGFAVGDSDYIEFIATCYHVVEGDVLGITVSTEGGVETKATVYAGLPAADLAILQLSQPIPNMEPLPIYTGPMDANIGEPAYALGFPGASDILFDKPDNFADDVSITSGIVSSSKTASIFRDTGKEVMVYQIDVPLSAGNSGGPLLNGEGEVIGVNSFGIDPLTKIYMSAENINGAISSQELVYLLDSNGIGYKSSQNGASPIIPVVIICACAVVAVSALIYFLKKKGKGQMKNKTNQYVTLDDISQAARGHLLIQGGGAFVPCDIQSCGQACRFPVRRHDISFPYNGGYSGAARIPDTDIGLCGPPANVISPGYSPLEKYRRDMPQGGYTDVYGLAAVIYKILFRQDPPDALARMDNDQAVTNSIGSLGVLQEYKDKLARAFGISPQERYQNAGEFIAQFAIRPPAPEASAGPKNGGKKKLLWLIPVAAVAAVAVISSVLISGNNKTIEEARGFIGQGRYTQAVNTFNSALFMPYEANGDYIYAQAGAAKQDESYGGRWSCWNRYPDIPGRTKCGRI
jgi:S1-C subfamily serine protease